MSLIQTFTWTNTLMIGIAFFVSSQTIQADEKIPVHAHPNTIGTGWECDSGYRSTGKSCEKFEVPANAKLNTLGNSWECNDGFKQSGNACVSMTLAEKDAQRIRRQQVMAAYLAGLREYDVSGDCNGESVSGTVQAYRGSRAVSGTLEYDSGQTVSFEGDWSGRGHIDGSDEFGNFCDLDVD